jgi:hypothetical protein
MLQIFYLPKYFVHNNLRHQLNAVHILCIGIYSYFGMIKIFWVFEKQLQKKNEFFHSKFCSCLCYLLRKCIHSTCLEQKTVLFCIISLRIEINHQIGLAKKVPKKTVKNVERSWFKYQISITEELYFFSWHVIMQFYQKFSQLLNIFR